jgi:Co/Zn/Cd efflux system component
MIKSTFHVKQMDCPSEDQIIRMALENANGINHIYTDIPNRLLYVYHSEVLEADILLSLLLPLNFGTAFIESTAVQNVDLQHKENNDTTILKWAFAINFAFFLIEAGVGLLSKSVGLLADGLDMLADASIYALALFVVNKSAKSKKNVAAISGYFQLILAFWGVFETLRRFFQPNLSPNFGMMILVSLFALLGNAITLILLQKSKNNEAHIQASKIFTSNDIFANLGVIMAGVLVYLTQSNIPDLVVGLVVFTLVAKGSLAILKLSK